MIYFIGAGAGLMVIGSISGMAKKSMGELAFVAVAVMAIGNAGGRILAGTLSDKIGRRWTLCLVLAIQAMLMFVAIPVTASKDMAAVVIVLLAAFIGANYGANLALFPSYTKDLWGLKTFGMNYGVLFTAWGVGGLRTAARAADALRGEQECGWHRRQLHVLVHRGKRAPARRHCDDVSHQAAAAQAARPGVTACRRTGRHLFANNRAGHAPSVPALCVFCARLRYLGRSGLPA